MNKSRPGTQAYLLEFFCQALEALNTAQINTKDDKQKYKDFYLTIWHYLMNMKHDVVRSLEKEIAGLTIQLYETTRENNMDLPQYKKAKQKQVDVIEQYTQLMQVTDYYNDN